MRPHSRFFYWAYWRGVPSADDRSRMWFMEPDCAYAFPNEDGLTLVLVAPHRDRLPEFRENLESAYLRFVAGLPDGPDLSRRDARVEDHRQARPAERHAHGGAARPRVRGRRGARLDPLWGVGCGWAFQSAEWLVDATADALAGGGPHALDAALDRYRRTHLRRLGPHHAMIADLATARRANPLERALYRAAVDDDAVFSAFEAIGARRRSPATLFTPRMVARLVGQAPRRAESMRL